MPEGTVFGPDYWLSRCDGFRVVDVDHDDGEVVDIVEVDGDVVSLLLHLRGEDVSIEPAGVLDIDPVRRVVVVGRSATSRR